jgi:ParB-like chromosome segregation protein Spo0J
MPMETRPNTPGFDAPETQNDHEVAPASRESQNAVCREPTTLEAGESKPVARLPVVIESEDAPPTKGRGRRGSAREPVAKGQRTSRGEAGGQVVGRVHKIAIDDIIVPPARRGINEEAVEGLVASMDKLGLQTPITVYRDEKTGQPTLSVGGQRLEAARRLGWTFIPAIIVAWEPEQRRRWELSENVDRAELTALERADQIAELIKLEVRPSPDEKLTQAVSVLKGGRGKKGGTRHAAKKLGLNREEARRSVKIAGLPVEAKKFAEKHGLANNLGVLQKAAEAKDPLIYLEHEVVRREKLATEAKRETENATEEYVNWLLEHADDEDIAKLITWIEIAKPRDVVAALRAP